MAVVDWRSKLPWIDGFAALSAGVLVLALADVLSSFYLLPRQLLLFTGAVNVAYSGLGLSLGFLSPRRRWLLRLLIAANTLWVGVCLALALRVGPQASLFGLLHFLGEGAFVATLAALEWKHREAILR